MAKYRTFELNAEKCLKQTGMSDNPDLRGRFHKMYGLLPSRKEGNFPVS